jgi:DNA-binding response OmpR family regulator
VARAARGRVLVVEDDASLREVLVEVLGAHGFEAYPTASCEEAARVARMWPPDAVVCDLQGTGHAALLAGWTATLLLCSGSGEPYLAAAARRLGAAAVLKKPCGVADLVAALDTLRPAAFGHTGASIAGRGAA